MNIITPLQDTWTIISPKKYINKLIDICVIYEKSLPIYTPRKAPEYLKKCCFYKITERERKRFLNTHLVEYYDVLTPLFGENLNQVYYTTQYTHVYNPARYIFNYDLMGYQTIITNTSI